ncbi:uncharacterized protein LOC134068994 [Sardina pilchardus]|uniref:uncharacterized protein LOC134068994 n=1 Tax=Sardina pilchardus TaxID=27697 RepID=UPI002E11AD44
MASRADTQLQQMASQTMTMRVILCDGDIRKVTLASRPRSVDDLITCLKNTLVLQYNFTLQFRDPEFDNELCNLTNVSELPEKTTVKIIPVLELVEIASENLNDSVCTADTVLLQSTSSQQMRMAWPDEFSLHKFSVDVEFRLRQGNLSYLKDGTYLTVSKELKHYILHKIAETLYDRFKAYPPKKDLRTVAKALIAAHPCLRETASPTGYDGWTQSLADKMGNYRTKMRALGHADVKVNSGKRGRHTVGGEPPNKSIKKPKKGEVNFLPNFPDGHDVTSLENARQLLVDEMKKKNPDAVFVNQQMDFMLSNLG